MYSIKNDDSTDNFGVAPFLDVNQAADYLRIHHITLRKLVRSGKVSSFRIGGGLRFRQEDLDRLMEIRHLEKKLK